ncbi:hypothetical protein DLJ47_06005 [Micromonospora sp. S4605]|nr:hypothetical protein DLJ47_06005 [Micromonospora sp. S4605]
MGGLMNEVEYARIAPLLPAMTPRRGGRWRDHRQVINGIVFRVRTGAPWRDVPARYGPGETLYKRFTRWQDGTWARIEAMLQADADAAGDLDGTAMPITRSCMPTSTPPALVKGAEQR